MGNPVKGFVVALEGNMHVDDANKTLEAIRQLKGVVDVDFIHSEVMADAVTRMATTHEHVSDLRELMHKWNTR